MRDFFYEPTDSRERYCGSCIVSHPELSFADVELVITHRVVINHTGLKPLNCCICNKIVTFGIPFRNYNCADCSSSLHKLLMSVGDVEFNEIVASLESVVVFHDVTREDGQ